MATRQAEAGTTIEALCRKLGISEASVYRRKKRYGSLSVPEIRKLRQLREQNKKLRSSGRVPVE